MIWKLIYLHLRAATKAKADGEPPLGAGRILTPPRALKGPLREAHQDPGDVEADRVVGSRSQLESTIHASAESERDLARLRSRS